MTRPPADKPVSSFIGFARSSAIVFTPSASIVFAPLACAVCPDVMRPIVSPIHPPLSAMARWKRPSPAVSRRARRS